jgi:hypothetical protein
MHELVSQLSLHVWSVHKTALDSGFSVFSREINAH